MRSAGGGGRNALPGLSMRARAAEEFRFWWRVALWPLSARVRPPERARRRHGWQSEMSISPCLFGARARGQAHIRRAAQGHAAVPWCLLHLASLAGCSCARAMPDTKAPKFDRDFEFTWQVISLRQLHGGPSLHARRSCRPINQNFRRSAVLM